MKTCSLIEPLEARIAPATLTITTLASGGAGSLFATVKTSHSGDTIVFKAGLQGLIHVNTQIIIDHDLTIKGSNQAITLTGDGATQIFDIDDGKSSVSNVSISGFVIRNGSAGIGEGGAIYSAENLTVSNCAFKQNAAEMGGAICMFGPQLTVQNSTFSSNVTDVVGVGGAIFASVQTLAVNGCAFAGNAAQTAAAIYGNTGSFTIKNSNFHANHAIEGPNIGVSAELHSIVSLTASSGQSTIAGTTFSQNDGDFTTVLVLGSQVQLALSQTIFDSNVNHDRAGGILGIYGSEGMTMTDCTVTNNTSFQSPAIAIYGGSLTMKNTSITGNHTDQKDPYLTFQGAGIDLGYYAKLTLDHSTIRNNTGGAGVHVFSDSSAINVIASIIKANDGGSIVYG